MYDHLSILKNSHYLDKDGYHIFWMNCFNEEEFRLELMR